MQSYLILILRFLKSWVLVIVIPIIFQFISFDTLSPDRHSEKPVFQDSHTVVFSDAAAGAANFIGLAGEEVNDDFSVDPRGSLDWEFTNGWRWKEGAENCCVATLKTKKRRGLWAPSTFSSGTLSARVKLVASATTLPPRGGLIFTCQPDGSFRYVLLRAGNPGRVIFGQKGTIDGSLPFNKTVKVGRVRKRRWYDLKVEMSEEGGVDVYLAGELALSDDTVQAATGRLGMRSIKSKVAFDDFSFFPCTGSFPGSDCRECHGDTPLPGYELAPNVMTYWDGSWWDDNYGANGKQQGGHGDPDGKPAMDCAGANGCHDLTRSRCTHANGVLEGRGNPTGNTYHLKAGFFTPDTSVAPGPWSVQVTFDNFCYNACHSVFRVYDHRKIYTEPTDPDHWSVEFGTRTVISDGESITYPVDSDLTTHASTDEPDFAPCVSCHDPHGTGATNLGVGENEIDGSNRMVRDNWKIPPTLCLACHH